MKYSERVVILRSDSSFAVQFSYSLSKAGNLAVYDKDFRNV